MFNKYVNRHGVPESMKEKKIEIYEYHSKE